MAVEHHRGMHHPLAATGRQLRAWNGMRGSRGGSAQQSSLARPRLRDSKRNPGCKRDRRLGRGLLRLEFELGAVRGRWHRALAVRSTLRSWRGRCGGSRDSWAPRVNVWGSCDGAKGVRKATSPPMVRNRSSGAISPPGATDANPARQGLGFGAKSLGSSLGTGRSFCGSLLGLGSSEAVG